MRIRLPLLLLSAAALAGEGIGPKEIFRKAVETQGKLAPDDVHDVTLTFEGEVHDQGETHTVVRTYRFRSRDRSFRVHTGSAAADKSTDRGVLGADGYWERSAKGRVIALSPGNRDDTEVIRQIDDERAEFERMLRMVLLTRLEQGFTVTLGEPQPVRLDGDHPHEIKKTLRDREQTYHVLDATREGEARLRLFVSTDDFTVRKAIEYAVGDPNRVQRVCYFAYRRKEPAPPLFLPWYFSVYQDTPVDEATREKLKLAWGLPKVTLNGDLKDQDLRPAG